jgi:hypothetical protein
MCTERFFENRSVPVNIASLRAPEVCQGEWHIRANF